jgi:hypothetical protein
VGDRRPYADLAVALEVRTFFRFERLCESYADASAFNGLSTDLERARVLYLMERETKEAIGAFGRSHFHTRLWHQRLAALQGRPRRSLFNPRGGTIFDPSAVPFALASAAAVILAWSGHLAPSWHLWVYAIWCASCQFIAAALFLIARNTDAAVRTTLNKRIVDGDSGAP